MCGRTVDSKPLVFVLAFRKLYDFAKTASAQGSFGILSQLVASSAGLAAWSGPELTAAVVAAVS